MGLNFKQLFLITVLVYFLAAIFSKGYHHFDEHFQIIEMANYKLGNVPLAEMPWELQNKMRPTIQPIIVYASIKAFHSIGVLNPFIIAIFLRMLSAALALFVYYRLFLLFKNQFSDHKALRQLFVWVSLLLWYLVYNGVRFSSENWSALILALGYAFYFGSKSKKGGIHLWVGFLFGIAFAIRFQSAFMSASLMLWMLIIHKEKVIHLFYQLLGIAFGIGVLIIADSWFYEEFTLSFWNYFEQGISENKTNTFVVRPWTFYFERFFSQGIPPVSLITMIAVLGFLMVKRKHPITWMMVPFMVIHFLVGHKELRFLFNIIPFLPFIIFSFLKTLDQNYQSLDKMWFKKFLMLTFYVNLVFVLVATFRPADPYISFYEEMYELSDSKTKLYFIDNNPYHRITNLYFYKPKHLEVLEYQEGLQYADTNTYLVIRGKTLLPNQFNESQLVYSSFPKWLYAFNFNNWIEKSGSMKLYKIN